MKRAEQYYQPTLPDANWGSYFDVEVGQNIHGDSFINLSQGGEKRVTYPIKYCNEGMLNTSLGVIACMAGRIDEKTFVKEMMTSVDDRLSPLSDEETSAREIRLAFDESLRGRLYGNTLYTYQGGTSVLYNPGDKHFSFQLEHDLLEKPITTFLDLGMIPVIANEVAAPSGNASAEYFAFARKVAGTISHLWLPTTPDN